MPTLQNIIFNPDTDGDNQGGINHQFVYVADLAWFDSVKAPGSMSGAANFAALATISENHTFTENGFIKLRVTLENGNIESPMAGEMDGKVFNNKLSFSIPGSKAEQLGFMRWVKDRDLILIAVEKNGQKRQIGSESTPARIEEMSGNLGGSSAGKKETAYVVSDFQPYPAPVYTGVITLNDDASGSGS